MKRVISLILSVLFVCFLFTACGEAQGGKGDNGGATAPAGDDYQVENVVSGTYNPLTGEAADNVDASLRPYCIMINNVPAARYAKNLSEASIVYEVSVEGATRLMAIYDDISDLEIGYVRSARTYYASICKAYDGIYVHWGRSQDAKENTVSYVKQNNIPDMDALDGDYTGYRSQERISEGRATEHTAYLKGSNVVSKAESLGYTQHKTGFDKSYGLAFSPDAASQCTTPASNFVVKYGTGAFATGFKYNSASGHYEVSMNKGGSNQYEYVDENGSTLEYTNVIVLNVKLSQTGDYKGHVAMDMTGSGTGYFCCGGNYVPIKWSRNSLDDSFRYTLEDGSALALGVGKTFVAVASLDTIASVDWNA